MLSAQCFAVLQYSYLLSSQLESQRLYFEEKMAHIEKDLTEQVAMGALVSVTG